MRASPPVAARRAEPLPGGGRPVLAGLLVLLAACGEITSFSLSISTWGGVHVGLTITASGGLLEYDCAMGRIDEPIVVRQGRFDVTGVHWPGMGGPIGVDTTRVPRPARYQGQVLGNRMLLTVTLTDTGQPLGTFELVRGANPQVFKCL
jgi:hypothetical protein